MKPLLRNTVIFFAALLCWNPTADAQCQIPEQISTKAIVSKKCSVAIFTSNREGLQRPYTVPLESSATNDSIAQLLPPAISGEFIAQDLSSNCADIALVKDTDGDQRFAVFNFNRKTQQLRRVSPTTLADSGLPTFSPNGRLLAFSASQTGYIYDLESEKFVHQFELKNHVSAISWAPSNRELILKDYTGKIFEYSLNNSKSTEFWSPSKTTFAQPLLNITKDSVYFVSDHQGDFSQLYRLERKSLAVKQLLPSATDQFDPTPYNNNLFFRSSNTNRYCLQSEKHSALVPADCDGVVFNFKIEDDTLWQVYSNYKSPTSIYQQQPGKPPKELLGIKAAQELKKPQTVPSSSSPVPHLLFTPDNQTNSLVIWLHGGPHENVSPRYNPFIANIVATGHAVLALNYPGSTGAGNKFELRGMAPAKMLKIQLADISETIRDFTEQHKQYLFVHLLGVSYGGGLAHQTLERFPSFSGIIDFSGKSEFSAKTIDALQSPKVKPALFIHGTNDNIAANQSRDSLFKKYKEYSKATFVELAKEGHVIRSKQNNQIACDAILDFLTKIKTSSS